MTRKIIRHAEQAEAMQDALEACGDQDKPFGRYALPASVFGSPDSQQRPKKIERFADIVSLDEAPYDESNPDALAPDSLNDPMDPHDPYGESAQGWSDIAALNNQQAATAQENASVPSSISADPMQEFTGLSGRPDRTASGLSQIAGSWPYRSQERRHSLL